MRVRVGDLADVLDRLPGAMTQDRWDRFEATVWPEWMAGRRRIGIAGRTLQLPADAYVSAYEPYVQCTAGTPCPDPPIYELHIGTASLRIEAQSGTVLEESIVEGQSGAFDFVREALR
jgi:hypothetical protein